jgi:hypothetical protein
LREEARPRFTARVRPAIALVVVLAACGEERAEAPAVPTAAEREPDLVPRREQEEGLARCGAMLEGMESPDEAPAFTRLVRECSGMWARRSCRDALAADVFSRDRIAEACRADYCADLRPPPPFCTVEMPTDAEFLDQFARWSRMSLRRDLRRIMDREGADEIADLFADLVESQAARE